jgi:hypothetical protein
MLRRTRFSVCFETALCLVIGSCMDFQVRIRVPARGCYFIYAKHKIFRSYVGNALE